MGTNSKTSHQSYTVAPTALAEPDTAPAPEAEAPQPDNAEQISDLMDALTAELGTAHNIAMVANADPVDQYQDFRAALGEAQKQVAMAELLGATPDQLKEMNDLIKSSSLGFLWEMETDDLQQIAAAAGFEHPALVGLSGKAQHPLVHWLDPAYAADAPSKAAIQAAAKDRYAKLCAGETVAGMTLADLHQLEGTPPGGGSIPMTPAQFVEAQAALSTAAQDYAQASYGAGKGAKLAALIDAENQLYNASCPELGAAAETAKQAARHQVDQVANPYLPSVQIGRAHV